MVSVNFEPMAVAKKHADRSIEYVEHWWASHQILLWMSSLVGSIVYIISVSNLGCVRSHSTPNTN